MFRSGIVFAGSILRNGRAVNVTKIATATVPSRSMSHGVQETDEEFDNRYIAYLSRKEIDGWEVRKAMNDLMGQDAIPEPKVIIAALHACRRINDYAAAIRIQEAVKSKCGHKVKEIFPWIMQEIQPTLTELGIDTLEQLGYDKPELALENVDDMD